MGIVRKLVLVGSGEFTKTMGETDQYLLGLVKNPVVAILPTAAGQEDAPEKWIEDGIGHFRRLGAEPFGLNVLNRNHAKTEKYSKLLKEASIIYFSGGNPGYLHSTLVDTPLWRLIFAGYLKGRLLAGSSAGAMVMGKYVFANAQEAYIEGKKPIWKPGFGLVNFLILPHFDAAQKEKPDFFKLALSHAPKEARGNWIGIDEDTALVILNDKEAKVMGKSKVYLSKNGEETVYKSGDSFILEN